MQTPYDRDEQTLGTPAVPTRNAEFRHPITHRWAPLLGDADPASPETWRDGSTIGWSVYVKDRGWLPLSPEPRGRGRGRAGSVADWAVLSLGLVILFMVVALVSTLAPRSTVDDVPVSDRSSAPLWSIAVTEPRTPESSTVSSS